MKRLIASLIKKIQGVFFQFKILEDIPVHIVYPDKGIFALAVRDASARRMAIKKVNDFFHLRGLDIDIPGEIEALGVNAYENLYDALLLLAEYEAILTESGRLTGRILYWKVLYDERDAAEIQEMVASAKGLSLRTFMEDNPVLDYEKLLKRIQDEAFLLLGYVVRSLRKREQKVAIKDDFSSYPIEILACRLEKIAYLLKGKLLSEHEEIELLAKQIAKLIKQGWDQAKIMRFMVSEGLYTADIFKKGWELYIRDYSKFIEKEKKEKERVKG